MENKQKINRKGQVGLETGRVVMLSVFFLVIVGFVLVILLGNLTRTPVAVNSGILSPQSETITSVAQTLRPFATATLVDCSASVSSVVNATSGTTIPATNFTVTACAISFNAGQGNVQGFNNSNWIVNYTGTFNSFGVVNSNVTGATAGFFSNSTTWFSLLGVVIVILIVTLVIFAVQRFGNRNQGI